MRHEDSIEVATYRTFNFGYFGIAHFTRMEEFRHDEGLHKVITWFRKNQKGGETMYAKLLSGKKELVPAAEAKCEPCGGIPVGPQMESEPICIPSGYVDGYC